MTVLFGTVKFFEREIINYLDENQLKDASEAPLYKITAKLENEIKYDFVCHERIRLECLNNLKYAVDMIQDKVNKSLAV